MGAYSYCQTADCGGGFFAASMREVINNEMLCPRCGRINTPNRTKDEVLIEMLERIETLEQVNELQQLRNIR